MDVNAIDVTGADGDGAELERLAAENVKRVVRGTADGQSPWRDRRLPRAEDRLAPDRPLDVWSGETPAGARSVFLHGLGPAGPRLVERAAKHWAEEHRVRVLAPAMPGWGASAPDAAEGMLPTQLAGAVERTRPRAASIRSRLSASHGAATSARASSRDGCADSS